MFDLNDILKEGYSKKASDIHFRSNEKIWFRINGELFPASNYAPSQEELHTVFLSIIPENKKNLYNDGNEIDFAWEIEGERGKEEKEEPEKEELHTVFLSIIPENKKNLYNDGNEIDFAWEIEGVVRFRINVYLDLKGLSACFRVLPSEIKNTSELDIPPSVLDLCSRKKGLILITGPTGSGKSTTMASLIDHINKVQNGHLITIEDPIEFTFEDKNCLINQREIIAHTQGFNNALRAALREDPDYVMLGEMRDIETTLSAIEVAETGHLVFSTIHTNSAASTIYRIINQFPKKKQDQIRITLASTLIGVISQILVPKASSNTRVAAREVMIVNHAISNLIRENKIFQIPNIIQMSQKQGMRTMNDSLIQLVEQGVISPVSALEKAPDPKQLEQSLFEKELF